MTGMHSHIPFLIYLLAPLYILSTRTNYLLDWHSHEKCFLTARTKSLLIDLFSDATVVICLIQQTTNQLTSVLILLLFTAEVPTK